MQNITTVSLANDIRETNDNDRSIEGSEHTVNAIVHIENVREELLEDTSNTLVSLEELSSTDVMVKCRLCSDMFTTEKEMNIHKSQNHQVNFECILCNDEFESDEGLDEHKRSKHNETVVCNVCGESFSSTKTLKAHGNVKHAVVQKS